MAIQATWQTITQCDHPSVTTSSSLPNVHARHDSRLTVMTAFISSSSGLRARGPCPAVAGSASQQLFEHPVLPSCGLASAKLLAASAQAALVVE
jgi:hypothetical protein